MNEHPKAADDKPVSAETPHGALRGELVPLCTGHGNFGSCICVLLYALATCGQVFPSLAFEWGIFPVSNTDKSMHWKRGGFVWRDKIPTAKAAKVAVKLWVDSIWTRPCFLIQQPLADPGRLKGGSPTSAARDLCTSPVDIKIWQTVPFCAQVVNGTSCTLPFFFQTGCACSLTLLPLLKPEMPIKVTFLIVPAVGEQAQETCRSWRSEAAHIPPLCAPNSGNDLCQSHQGPQKHHAITSWQIRFA